MWAHSRTESHGEALLKPRFQVRGFFRKWRRVVCHWCSFYCSPAPVPPSPPPTQQNLSVWFQFKLHKPEDLVILLIRSLLSVALACVWSLMYKKGFLTILQQSYLLTVCGQTGSNGHGSDSTCQCWTEWLRKWSHYDTLVLFCSEVPLCNALFTRRQLPFSVLCLYDKNIVLSSAFPSVGKSHMQLCVCLLTRLDRHVTTIQKKIPPHSVSESRHNY